MSNTVQKEKKLCWLSLIVLADRALLPTTVKTSQGHFDIEPITEVDYRDRGELIKSLAKAMKTGNPIAEAPPIEDQKKQTPMEKRAGAKSWADLERKSIYFSIMVYPSNVRVEAWGRAPDKTWSDEKDTVLDTRVPSVSGVEGVADAILEHLSQRSDLPGLPLARSA